MNYSGVHQAWVNSNIMSGKKPDDHVFNQLQMEADLKNGIRSPLIAIVGETASGKTATAITVAQKFNGEIICADSRTLYKGMDIGTAKPTLQERADIPHHMIDIILPDEQFSVAMFKDLTQKCIQDILKRGRVPILVGGTGLYIDAVLYNFQFGKPVNSTFRAALEQMSDVELTTIMNTKNIKIPNLNTKNRRHVIRAIERNGVVQRQRELRKDTLVLGLRLQRAVLEERVTQRVDQMIVGGLIDESERLFEIYGTNVEALRTPGYKAIQSYLAGACTIEEAKRAFISADLRLAKRQRTWFKRNHSIEWFQDSHEIIRRVGTFLDYSQNNQLCRIDKTA